MDNSVTKAGVKMRDKLTRNPKNLESKTNGAFESSLADMPRRSISISEMRGASILSTVGGSKMDNEPLPEFNRPVRMRHAVRHGGAAYEGNDEVEIGSINLGASSHVDPAALNSYKMGMTPVPGVTSKMRDTPMDGFSPTPGGPGKLTRYAGYGQKGQHM